MASEVILPDPNAGTVTPYIPSDLEEDSPSTSRASSVGLAIFNALICRKKRDFQTYGEVGTYFRKITFIDYSIVTALRVYNATAGFLVGNDVIPEEDLKTHRQKKQERQIISFKEQLGRKSVYVNFSKETALLVHEIFPKVIGEKMAILPMFTEACFLYRMWIPYRYANYQFDKHLKYRDFLIASDLGRWLSRMYCLTRSKLCHAVLAPKNVNPVINFEHVFLELCTKMRPHIADNPGGSTFGNVVIQSLSESISLIEKVNADLKDREFDSPNDRFIARLDWYSEQNKLPKGMPDPRKVSLTNANLEEKLDEAMYDYLDEVTEVILEKAVPKKIKSKFVRMVYFLEGKDFLKSILSYLIGELVVKQVSDPHLFALAILYANGIEVAEYELDGFGRGTKKSILGTGKSMLKDCNKDGVTSEQLVRTFENSKLKVNLQSREGIEQKKITKETLRKFIVELLYQNLKGDDFSYDSWFKGIRQSMQKMSIAGVAVAFFHVAISTIIYSMEYFIRHPRYRNMEYIIWMTRKLTGREFYQSIADAIVDLIYDPSWRFIAMHMIESIVAVAGHRTPDMHLPKETTVDDHFLTICRFAFTSLTKYMGAPEGLFDFIQSQERLKNLRSLIKPSGKPFPETIMESLIPTIREYMLYYRLTEYFRMKGVYFEGDSKFWEVYVREFLNESIEVYDKKHFQGMLELSNKAALRERFVDTLLSLDTDTLGAYLSNDTGKSPLQDLPESECTMFENVLDDTTIDQFLREEYSGDAADKTQELDLEDFCKIRTSPTRLRRRNKGKEKAVEEEFTHM